MPQGSNPLLKYKNGNAVLSLKYADLVTNTYQHVYDFFCVLTELFMVSFDAKSSSHGFAKRGKPVKLCQRILVFRK